MSKKIEKLYEFMLKNRQYNRVVQEGFYEDALVGKNGRYEKVISLLFQVVNTQSQPNIDKLASFFQKIYREKDKLYSYTSFLEVIGVKSDEPKNYLSLFASLRKHEGWGDKTSALFVKCLYHIHCGDYHSRFMIWDDIPQIICDEDRIYLPVDVVIEHIFKEIGLPTVYGFKKINKYLEHYRGMEIEVWDDLWFWGFVTQKGNGIDRVIGWNENKYWNLFHSEKSPEKINEIKERAKEFIKILQN